MTVSLLAHKYRPNLAIVTMLPEFTQNSRQTWIG